jgi:tetratricopeptide (TPR) repeat protein
MRKAFLMTATLGIAGLLVATTGCDKLKSRDHLNQGVNAFKNAKYSDAVEHFKEAIALDPSNPNAQLYLATAYMSQWIPGAESPENVDMASKAVAGFMKVLDQDPNNTTALASLASINYNEASSLPPDKKLEKLDEAAKWYKKLIEADPKNKEAYYSLGVISWAKWYPQDMTARANLRMKPEDPGPIKDKKVKDELKTQYSAIIEDGIANLQKALDIDKEYDDAMAYMNLLVRERADLADSPDDYKKQVEIADSWVQKALDTKKLKQSRQPTNQGITAEPAK